MVRNHMKFSTTYISKRRLVFFCNYIFFLTTSLRLHFFFSIKEERKRLFLFPANREKKEEEFGLVGERRKNGKGNRFPLPDHHRHFHRKSSCARLLLVVNQELSRVLTLLIYWVFWGQVVYQFIFFVITALFKFDQVTDFAGTFFIFIIFVLISLTFTNIDFDSKNVWSGSTNFVILAVLTLVLKGTWHFRQVRKYLFFSALS